MPTLTTSHATGRIDTPLIEETIGQHFGVMARRFPSLEALVFRHQGVRLTYAELDSQTDRLASALLRTNLQPGDRVAIWAHNGFEWLLMQIATAKVGIVLVNVNPAYRVSELEYALNKVGCKLLVTMTTYKTSDYLSIVRDLAPELARSKPGELTAARVPALRTVVQLGAANEQGMLSFTDLLARGSQDDVGVAEVGAKLKNTDPINIQFTSGTTGFPKGATLTHRNILNNGFFIGEAMRLTEVDRLCVPVPLYHCFGMVLGNLACLTHGATIVYPNDGFDPLTVLETVQAEKCTGLHGVPTMFIAELAHPRFAEFDLSTLRTGIMAGSPCPIEVMKQVVSRMHMDQVTIAYGMTETSPASCQSGIETPLEKRVATVGEVHPHLEIKVIDPETKEVVAIGETGEFCTKGYSVMHGYWDDIVKTRDAIDEQGWMHTGDLATMDAEGYVNIVGRIKDMVIRGGENVYPREIEEFLYRHPSVSDVQVIGFDIPAVPGGDAQELRSRELSQRFAVTRTFIVPAVVRLLLDAVEASGQPAPPIKTIYYGAAPMDTGLIERCLKVFGACGFGQFYGMTEAAGSVTFLAPREHDVLQPNRLRSVGRALPGYDLEVRDQQGQLLKAGEHGELWVRTPTMMIGYWKLPEATAEAMEGGWYRTGDGAYMDADGYVFMTDRIKDMIISGGENVYPVEQVLRLHPAVQDVVVVGVPDEKWGEGICSVVEWRAGQSATLDELRDFARSHIAAYKLPRVLQSTSMLRRTATGKLQRGEVRKQTRA